MSTLRALETDRWVVFSTLVALGLALGCEDQPYLPENIGGTVTEGGKCTASSQCVAGLSCSGYGTCQQNQAAGTRGTGQDCSVNTDCLYELVCAGWGKCIVSKGTAKEGEACKTHDQCEKGLVCGGDLACRKKGSTGTANQGDACTANKSCMLGLVCIEGKCAAPAFWAGATCKGADTGTPRALFRVPRTGRQENEFYSLPFPNDARLKNGKVHVSDHPNPEGVLPKPYDGVVKSLLTAISGDVTGFGLNTATFLRTSTAIDFSTLTLTGQNPTLEMVNITKSSAEYGRGVAVSMFATTSKGKYICENNIALRPRIGHPLLRSTTYAVMLRQGIKDTKGQALTQDEDFKSVMQDTQPSDADLAAAWTAYAPLRAYLKDKSLATGTVLSAAVFTTMDPHAHAARLRARVSSAGPEAKVHSLTLCNGTNPSPCADAKYATHACPAHPDAAFDELQGLLEVPVLQAGTRPYKTSADGGAIAYDSSGDATVVKTEKVCFAMTVPKGTMPAAGWPVVVFAHGTGGNYRTFINNGVAKALASVTDPSDSTKSAQFVVVSMDGSLHGPRSGTTASPDALFFNLLNPRAARDNVVQGMADRFQLVRMVKALSLTASASPTQKELKVDPKHLYFFGHSQGTITGLPFLAYEPDVRGAVLSGAGGYLIGSVLEKTKPVNVAGAVYLALADPQLGTTHPLLNLMQLLFEEVDAVNYGQAVFYRPKGTVGSKHALLTMGVSDSYTPPSTTKALAWSMEIPRLDQDAERCGDTVCTGKETCSTCTKDCGACLPGGGSCGNATCEASQKETCRNCPGDCTTCPAEFTVKAPPLRGNAVVPNQKITAALVQYAGEPTYDDHFVAFSNKIAKQQWTHFLGSAVWDTENVPTIPKASTP